MVNFIVASSDRGDTGEEGPVETPQGLYVLVLRPGGRRAPIGFVLLLLYQGPDCS